ncbi:ferric reductase NAD binding domain-containing protein [Suillus subalutaceus]|uniref:ferric reductase NAD binding domain-containing protein n=1 Tax=Suillus subalutaceus TaxID=48586 RepID=UPI001B875413|nr:ferric reductase NAD binding domain-containing protein [Suillus subalutaceus]KAG1858984.1 ferric reductase NAD binding domain-containing protein [Suillus subalutaceus]
MSRNTVALSAPEEDYISVHIRVVGDLTAALAKAVGCNFDSKDSKDVDASGGKVIGTNANPPFNRDFLNYETVFLVGAGIGVTPFASIPKSIWYRMNNLNNSKPTRLSKVYFTWVIRDFGSAEWINIYLTAKIKEDDMNNIIVQDVGAEKDAIPSLRAPTHFGRPNWDRVFGSIVEKHPETDVGVVWR